MKQNFIGFLLFSVIIGTSVFVSGLFVNLPSPPKVEEKPFVFEKRTSCDRGTYQRQFNPLAKIKVTQSVLNRNTNQLNTQLLIERENSNIETLGVSYHFFIKNGKETRYLATETAAVKPNFDSNNKAFQEIISSYAWLDELNAKDNLYLIPEVTRNGFVQNASIPRFDQTNATAVLLMKGKK